MIARFWWLGVCLCLVSGCLAETVDREWMNTRTKEAKSLLATHCPDGAEELLTVMDPMYLILKEQRKAATANLSTTFYVGDLVAWDVYMALMQDSDTVAFMLVHGDLRIFA